MVIKTWPPSTTYIPPGVIARSDLIEDALQAYGIPIHLIKAADGADLALAETAGDHFISLAANVWLLEGEEAISETEVSVSNFQFVLPPEYVSGGDVKLRLKHQCTGAGTNGASTIDVEAYEQTGNGAVGADLCTTVAQTVAKDSWTTSDFVITATGLVAGDILNFKITTSIIESAGSALAAQIDGIAVLLDVKG